MTANASGNRVALRLAGAADYPAEKLSPLETRIATSETFHEDIDLVHEGVGENLPQGSLFAYLFRRFGYPNRGSDNYKDLASYLLTTARPDMLMLVTPYAGGDTSLSFRFFVPGPVSAASRAWNMRSRTAHREAFRAWIEAEGRVPEWLRDTFRDVAAGGFPVRCESRHPTLDASLSALEWLRFSAKKDDVPDHRVAWLDAITAEYEALHPAPAPDLRDPDWRTWDEADPLKPYAEAIHATLRELERPVWVRDCPITIRGAIGDDEASDLIEMLGENPEEDDPTPYARAAGYPSGDLGNADPELFAEIHRAILALGGGDAIRGMTAAIGRLRPEETEPGPEGGQE